jgi:hypothetical protein
MSSDFWNAETKVIKATSPPFPRQTMIGELMIIRDDPIYTSSIADASAIDFSRKESNGGLVIARQIVGFSRHRLAIGQACEAEPSQ